ncbi:hypothetical protein [Bradyrhizobium quebecense]|uniref:Uncharacterized protein n=2 Tax=Bradyrhizobium quebecense TaxID=2748629 RepID=A0ABS3MAV1_9BRAD|nr:hypothetical protein [Bradyrhizobium quebecense]UGY03903.1 hypothetical protein J4P68_0003785 [Bradyrhizobium quebecense]
MHAVKDRGAESRDDDSGYAGEQEGSHGNPPKEVECNEITQSGSSRTAAPSNPGIPFGKKQARWISIA